MNSDTSCLHYSSSANHLKEKLLLSIITTSRSEKHVSSYVTEPREPSENPPRTSCVCVSAGNVRDSVQRKKQTHREPGGLEGDQA